MVEREREQTDARLHRDGESLGEERRDRLLQRGHVEEAVHELHARHRRARTAVGAHERRGDANGRADEEALLQALEHPRLQGAHDRGQHEASEQHERQHEDRLQHGVVCDGADEGLHRDGDRERREPDETGKHDEDAEVTRFAPEVAERQR